MRYFSALCARIYRFRANSRATISSTAIFLSQQSRQYFSSPRGSETSLAPHSAQRDLATDLRGIPNCSSDFQLLTSDFRLERDPFLQGRRIHPARVLLHHPPRRELGRHRADRLLDGREPAMRHVGPVAIVEGRDHLFLEQPI